MIDANEGVKLGQGTKEEQMATSTMVCIGSVNKSALLPVMSMLGKTILRDRPKISYHIPG